MNKESVGISVLLGTVLMLGTVYAANNFFRTGDNWDANVASGSLAQANDIFTLTGRIDIEPEGTTEFDVNDYRGKITGVVTSKLFGNFPINGEIDLYYKQDYTGAIDCGTGGSAYEVFSLSGSILSSFWGEMSIVPSSHFCDNQYMNIMFNSPSLGNKNIGDGDNSGLVDNFGKQQIAITGIANLKGDDGDGIHSRGDQDINRLDVSVSNKTVLKKYINKNLFTLRNTFKDIVSTTDTSLDNFSGTKPENYYFYDYSSTTGTAPSFDGGSYINNGETLEIGTNGNNNIPVNGKHTVVVEGGNVLINSNLYNTNDTNSVLIVVAKRDTDGKGGNIYIDSDVTNIDAVIIADGSVISVEETTNTIQDVENYPDNLRKQLLIFGSVLSSNSVGTDVLPYGSDYYDDTLYPLTKSIYDLGNLRTFNVNYGSGDIDGDGTNDDLKLVPLADTTGTYKQYAWVGGCQWFNGIDCDSDLRGTTKRNPLIIEYNPYINILKPYILQQN